MYIVSCCVFVPLDLSYESGLGNLKATFHVYIRMYVCMQGPVCMNMYIHVGKCTCTHTHVHTT